MIGSADLKLMVGLGSQTRQKSAMRAIMTLAKTKSSSLLKFSPLFVYSAVPLAAIPMPICMPSSRFNMGPNCLKND